MTPTETVSTATHVAPPASLSLAGEALKAVALRFPPRPAEDHWAATACARADILARLTSSAADGRETAPRQDPRSSPDLAVAGDLPGGHLAAALEYQSREHASWQ